jgi:uncharacterized membrane protein YdjX (TVP38/TMEM64 family)
MGELAHAIEVFIKTSGPWAYVLAYGYTIAVAIVPFPAEFPAMLNGMLFGPVVGTVITWSAALLGAEASFELSRRFGRPLVARFVRPRALERADQLVIASGAPGLLLLRLTPVIAFTAINWVAGLTALDRWTFMDIFVDDRGGDHPGGDSVYRLGLRPGRAVPKTAGLRHHPASRLARPRGPHSPAHPTR